MFGALANPTRRDTLDTPLGGEHTAGRSAGKFDMSRPSVSEHLRAPREAGLVEERHEGRHRHYSVTGKPMAELIDRLAPYERIGSTAWPHLAACSTCRPVLPAPAEPTLVCVDHAGVDGRSG